MVETTSSIGQVHTRNSDQIEYLPIMRFTPGHFQMDLTNMDVFKRVKTKFLVILRMINVNTRKLYMPINRKRKMLR